MTNVYWLMGQHCLASRVAMPQKHKVDVVHPQRDKQQVIVANLEE
jgi:hypothetical protein